MKPVIQKILVAFFILAFLTPMVYQGIHDLEHASDIHCTETDAKHFHEQEHACYVCVFVLPAVAAPDQPPFTFHTESVPVAHFITYKEPCSVALTNTLRLRGPPFHC